MGCTFWSRLPPLGIAAEWTPQTEDDWQKVSREMIYAAQMLYQSEDFGTA
jgi:hypothetical protein